MVFFITKRPGRKRSEGITVRANKGCCTIMPRQQQKGDGEKEARERGYEEHWEAFMNLLRKEGKILHSRIRSNKPEVNPG